MKWSTLAHCRAVDCQSHEGTVDDFAKYVEVIRGFEKDGPSICCADFKGNKRALANVLSVSALMLDFDDVDVERPSQALGFLSENAVVIHSSYSHGMPGSTGIRFRAFVPFSRPVTADEYSALWSYIHGKLEHKPDSGAKDASRLNFLRREQNSSAEKKAFFHFSKGALLDPDALGVLALVEAERKKETVRRERERELAAWRTSNSSDEHGWISGALHYVDPDEYETWRDVGMAIKRAGDEEGMSGAYSLWDGWSRGSSKYDAKNAQKIWDSFRGASPHGVITLGTVWHLATRGGWEPPRKEPSRWNESVPVVRVEEVVLKSNGDHYLSEYALQKLGAKDNRVVFDGNLWQLYDQRTGVFDAVEDLVYLYVDNMHGARIAAKPNAKGDAEEKFLNSSHTLCTTVEKKSKIKRKDASFFDRQTPGLAFSDGFFDTTKCEMRPHSPSHRATIPMGMPFPDGAICPNWERALSEVLSPDDGQTLEEYLGMCLMGRATYVQRSLFLVGGGSNGKSTMIEAVVSCFPQDSISNVSPHMLSSQKSEYYMHDIKGRLLNLVSDMESSDINNLGVFKSIISGDSASGRAPFGQIIQFKPIAGHVFACNRLPNSGDSSDGMWRRTIVLNFDAKFGLKGGLEKDVTLPMKLKAERAGIIRRLIAAGQCALERGDIFVSASSEQATEEWRERSSPVRAFIVEKHDKFIGRVPVKVVYDAYKSWAGENGRGCLNSTNFGVELVAEGVVRVKSSTVFYDFDPWRTDRGILLDVPF